MPRAGVDIDNVLYPWTVIANEVLFAKFGIDPGEWTCWDHGERTLRERLGDACGREAWRWLFSPDCAHRWDLWGRSAVVPGALEGVRRLLLSHDVYLITKRPRIAVPYTYRWLLEYGIYPTAVIHLHPDSSVGNVTPGHDRSKADVPCDWYVDDSADEVERLVAAGRRAFLFDGTWNRECTAGTRVRGWDELKKEVFR